MQIEMFDVGHGHCAVITAPYGRRMMLDCGDRWSEETFPVAAWHGVGSQSSGKSFS